MKVLTPLTSYLTGKDERTATVATQKPEEYSLEELLIWHDSADNNSKCAILGLRDHLFVTVKELYEQRIAVLRSNTETAEKIINNFFQRENERTTCYSFYYAGEWNNTLLNSQNEHVKKLGLLYEYHLFSECADWFSLARSDYSIPANICADLQFVTALTFYKENFKKEDSKSEDFIVRKWNAESLGVTISWLESALEMYEISENKQGVQRITNKICEIKKSIIR